MDQFKELIDKFDCVLLDAHGVFWGSSTTGLLPGAKEAMEYLVKKNKKIGILSNSSQLVENEKMKWEKHGLKEKIHYDFVLTSGEITKKLLFSQTLPFSTPNKKYWLLGEDHPKYPSHRGLFQGTSYVQTSDLQEADFIYIGIPHINGVDQEKGESFSSLLEKISRKDIPVLCVNPDRFAHEGTPPRLVIRQGSIAEMLQNLGFSVYYIGKPHELMFNQALDFFNSIEKANVLMIGDTPETDIKGARRAGISCALVTNTGIMKERCKEDPLYTINQLNDKPDFFIPAFSL